MTINATNPDQLITIQGATSNDQVKLYCSFCRRLAVTMEETDMCCAKQKARQLRRAKELTIKYNRIMREAERIAEELEGMASVELTEEF